ncbi:serine hydrolase domain-containing protein [Arthrobacter sp. 260]|uniref:serine hydrolase domain-containing protein n=1 Tax=Arthrobacter sp. 260 TaxID=2735314 RepID=UPI001492F182|nr:serine hydrolase domain-containing protein [Arthrobacter sp. 260]NOJ58383.1 beta-lactamase family protein [Arthrobacter sp. 260]
MTSRWRSRLLPLTCLVAVVAIVAASAPRLPGAEPHTSGDPTLARIVELHRPAGTNRIATAVVGPDGSTFAGFGADPADEFEIGSISKVLNGMLLADAVDREEVTLDTPVGDLLDVKGSPVAEVTLRELATHTSGLPRLPADLGFTLRAILTNYTAGNPYTDSPAVLLERARNAGVDPAGTFEYSNFGAALLGQALAAQAGLSYPELLRERITDPLGMKDTYVPAEPKELRPQAVQGYATTGKAAQPWTMGGMSPAGGVRSTSADLALLAGALLDGTAPGSRSLDPVDSAEDTPMGLTWFIGTPSDPEADAYRWHNGQTGGFAGMLILDLDSDRASIVLSNVSGPVDELGAALMTGVAQ